MSWQAYVDTSLVATGHIDKAAIYSAAGDSVWASSPGFKLEPDEIKNVVEILSGPGPAVDKAHAEGVHIDKERYVVTRVEERSFHGRKGRTGVVVAKTKQAILIGHYPETVQAGNASQTVEALADYLISVNY